MQLLNRGRFVRILFGGFNARDYARREILAFLDGLSFPRFHISQQALTQGTMSWPQRGCSSRLMSSAAFATTSWTGTLG